MKLEYPNLYIMKSSMKFTFTILHTDSIQEIKLKYVKLHRYTQLQTNNDVKQVNVDSKATLNFIHIETD